MQVLVLITGCSIDGEGLCEAWWVNKQRSLGNLSWEVVSHAVVLPNWYIRLSHIFDEFKRVVNMKSEDVFICAGYYLLNILILILFCVLRWLVVKMIRKGIDPLPFQWVGCSELGEYSGSLQVGIVATVLPDTSDIVLKERSNQVCHTLNFSVAMIESRRISIPLLSASFIIPAVEKDQSELVQELPHSEVPPTTPFSPSIENEMKKFYNTLSEKDKRRYAGIEALKMKHGGIVYIGCVLGCSRKTVAEGIRELKELPDDAGYEKRIRISGGGRKKYNIVYSDIDNKFLKVIRDYTAGDPLRSEIRWTNLTHTEISEKLSEKYGISVSTIVIRQLLKTHNYRRRKLQKKQTMKEVENRNEQFNNIAIIKTAYQATGNPVMSIDTKKKETIGNFYRDGYLYTQEELHVYDHDFNSFGKGIVITHGIYDLRYNTGYINLGSSKDTSEFACDCLRNWWYNQGRYDYPNAMSILLLCDGGGSNSSRSNIFKEDLQKLVDEIGIQIRIAHYPPYTSKYNPIEHRLFPHVTRACQGVVFNDIKIVKELMKKTKTNKGLRVTVNIIEKMYEINRKVDDNFKENMTILFDDDFPLWNYRVVPNGKVI